MQVQAPGLWSSPPIHACTRGTAEANHRLFAAFAELGEADFTRCTHFFGGRWENLYVARERIPELAEILRHASDCAAAIVGQPAAALRCGFWFNAQGPGQATSVHNHDENDELLSGVYYVHVPENSGDLVLEDGPLTVRCTPRDGLYLFFPPRLNHWVEPNRSTEQRLSIAFNFGPLQV